MRIREMADLAQNYADAKQNKSLADALAIELPQGKFTAKRAQGTKPIPHIRVQKLSLDELKEALVKFGAGFGSPDLTQSRMSGKYPVHSIDIDGIKYSFVIASVGKNKDSSAVGINRKELAPTGLGLDGAIYTRKELITSTKEAIDNIIRDPKLKDCLMALVDIAANRGSGKLAPEQEQRLEPILGTVSQDFGEILAPIIIMDDNDTAELPAGNNPIIDVKLKSMNLSVKALTGSGTSFRTIKDLMDKYENSIINDPKKLSKYAVLKQFHPNAGGSNKDKIIAASMTAAIPEYKKLCGIFKVKNIPNFETMLSLTKKITMNADYGTFLKTVYPAMTAGNWGVPTGLPADGAYYLGQKDVAPKRTYTAGKASFDASPALAAADILTYVVGVGLLNSIRKGKDSKDYSEMMTSIVKQANAVLGHITINPNGSMKVITRPFSDMKFEFQYHAPSHLPGNNLPGFIGILD